MKGNLFPLLPLKTSHIPRVSTKLMKGEHGCEMKDVEIIEQIPKIDWWGTLIAIVVLLIVIKILWSLADWFLFKQFGIETKKMRQIRQDRELLATTAALAKTTAENLDKLQKKHCKDEEEFRNNLNNYMEESRQDRRALHEEMTTYSMNRINDRQQSLEIQKELTDSQNKTMGKVEDICEKLNAMEEKENQRVQSEIKERIAQSYRKYEETQQISYMELEALEDLIKTYEAHGGENSFVHSVVQKEMYTWKVK